MDQTFENDGCGVDHKAGIEAEERYKLLIHSLIHEHTCTFFDRHVLLLEKWCRDYYDGFFIRDLEHVIVVMQILKSRIETHKDMFRHILSTLLEICSKPLLESKANERLRAKGLEYICSYLRSVATFWNCSDTRLKTEVARCFQCIVSGGEDPTVLRADRVIWIGDGTKLQVTEKSFIQNLMRESCALEAVVEQYNESIDCYILISEIVRSESSPNVLETKSGETQNNNDDDSDDDLEVTNNLNSSTLDIESVKLDENNNNDKSINGSVSNNNLHDKIESNKLEKSYCQELSNVMSNLCATLATNDKNASELCSLRICDASVKLLQEVSRTGPRDPRIAEIINLMWTVLECFLKQPITDSRPFDSLINTEVMKFETNLSILQEILLKLLHDGYRLMDKECRNEVVVVLILISQFPAAFSWFLQSGLLKVLITYSCITEAGKNAWSFYSLPMAKFRNFGSVFDVDLQLKRFLWMILGDLLKYDDPDSLLCVGSSPLLSTMLMYNEFNTLEVSKDKLGAEDKYSQSQQIREGSSALLTGLKVNDSKYEESVDEHGSPKGKLPLEDDANGKIFLDSVPLHQMRELQVLSIVFLAQVAPKIIGEFHRINGPVRILDIIFQYRSSSLPEHKELIYNALLLVSRCLMGSNIVQHIMKEENAIHTLLYILEHSDEDRTKALTSRIIAILCTGSNICCQHQVRSQNGIIHFIRLIHNYSEFRKPLVGSKGGIKLPTIGEETVIEDSAEDPRSGDFPILITATLDSIGQCVVGNKKNEARFAKEEGIDAILELLEIAPYVLRTQLLRLISDLLENQRLLIYLHAWRSPKTMRSAAQLVAHCWLDEESRLDGVRLNGIVGNIFDPLGNHKWPVDLFTQITGDSISIGSEITGGDMSVKGQSLAVTRLANAILASKNITHGAVPMDIRSQVLEKDTRVIVAYIFRLMGLFESLNPTAQMNANQPQSPKFDNFENIENSDEKFLGDEESDILEQGFDEESKGPPIISSYGDLGLSPADKQVLSIAKQYFILREGEWFKNVVEELAIENVIPIEADFAMIEAYLERSFDAAQTVQLEQMALAADDSCIRKESDDAFINMILNKKAQQIKVEWLKKNGGKNKNKR
jgi:hypothetical protein